MPLRRTSINSESNPSKLEAIKLEYGFVSSHLRDIVNARLASIGVYLAALGIYFNASNSFLSFIAINIITFVIWRIELRNRVIIRTCTRRLTSIERDFFKYSDGFFVSSHPLHTAEGRHDPVRGTINDVREVVFIPYVIFRMSIWFLKFKRTIRNNSSRERHIISDDNLSTVSIFRKPNRGSAEKRIFSSRFHTILPKSLMSLYFVQYRIGQKSRFLSYSATMDILFTLILAASLLRIAALPIMKYL